MRWFVFTRPTSSNIAVQIGFLEDSHTALTSSHLTNNLFKYTKIYKACNSTGSIICKRQQRCEIEENTTVPLVYMLQVIRHASLTLSLPNTAKVEVQQNFQIDFVKC